MSKRSSESEIKDFKTELRCLFVCVCVFTFLLLDKIGFFENFNLTFLALFCYEAKLKWQKQGTPTFHMSQIVSIKKCVFMFVCLFVVVVVFFFFSTNSQRNFIPYSLCFAPFILSFDEVAYFLSRNCIDCIFPNWVIIIINLVFFGGGPFLRSRREVL